jgi:hypothetical protein
MRRLLAIGFIWLCCAGAWAILGGTLLYRSSTSTGGLGRRVEGLWGPEQGQLPPRAEWTETVLVADKEQRLEGGKEVTVSVQKPVEVVHPLPLDRTDVAVKLALEQRQKGLLWFPTYAVDFRGRYAVRNDESVARAVSFRFPLTQGQNGVEYDDFRVVDGAGHPVEVAFVDGAAVFRRTLAPGATLEYEAAYRTRGTFRWTYGKAGEGLGPEAGRTRGFRLTVETDFGAVDFPDGALSPVSQARVGGGWRGEWRFEQLVGSKAIGVVMPERLNPGPLAASITFFAPVALLFFFFVVGMALAARRTSIHPINYFLLACAFFAFHLLFAYLIDHLSLAVAFAVSAAVSVGLVVSYARLLLGWRTALSLFGPAQVLYLVLFSISFFWEGYTGLAITAGAILTLFVMMQLTGRLDWGEVLGRPAARITPGSSGTAAGS